MTSKTGKHLGVAQIEFTPPLEEMVRMSVSLDCGDATTNFYKEGDELRKPETTIDLSKSIMF